VGGAHIEYAMTVKYFANYRDITKKKEENAAAAPDVWALLAALGERYGPAMKAKLFSADGTDINGETIILVNGRNIHHINGKHTPLSETDEISIFPVVAGG